MRRPKQIEREEDLYAYALRALMRRAHSVYEMKQALTRRCADANTVKDVLARLREQRLLDDARYAKQFTRHRSESRRQGRFRIARELRTRGVADAHIEAALDEMLAETDEAAQVRKRIERKLKLHRGALDQRKIASLYGSLLRAGFPGDIIRRELRAASKHAAELPEIEDGAAEPAPRE